MIQIPQTFMFVPAGGCSTPPPIAALCAARVRRMASGGVAVAVVGPMAMLARFDVCVHASSAVEFSTLVEMFCEKDFYPMPSPLSLPCLFCFCSIRESPERLL